MVLQFGDIGKDLSWSSDGSKIAYTRVFPLKGEYDQFEIFVMNADGTRRKRLTYSEDVDNSPTWSPDGKFIAFSTGSDPSFSWYAIAMMDADIGYRAPGRPPTDLTKTKGRYNAEPAWSGDGHIAFVRTQRASGSVVGELWVMNADGSSQRRLTAGDDHSPEWSPDSRKIAFFRKRKAPGVYVINADGSGQRRITNSGGDASPKWSPDGRMLAFTRTFRHPPQVVRCDELTRERYPDDICSQSIVNSEIFVIASDGSGKRKRKLTAHPADDSDPTWSPDGSRIFFLSRRPRS
jgi:Tol biopolymer transport system component